MEVIYVLCEVATRVKTSMQRIKCEAIQPKEPSNLESEWPAYM